MKVVSNMAKKDQKKPREEVIEFYADTIYENIELTYDHINDSISLKNATTSNARIETVYKKASGKEKRTNSTPINSTSLSFKHYKGLLENFDLLVAIDTNTKSLNNQNISLTMSCYLENPLPITNNRIMQGAHYLFININDGLNPEKLGWHTIISNHINMDIAKKFRIGIIVDSDLASHNSINERKAPYFDNFYLPDNMQLVYASSDSTTDSIVNQMIRFSDKYANAVMLSDKFNELLISNNLKSDSTYCERYFPIHA